MQTLPRRATELLRQDHLRIRQELEAFGEAEDSVEQINQLDTLLRELKTHLKLEEQVFYPAIQEATYSEDLTNDTLEAHQELEAVMEDLEHLHPTDPAFRDKFNEFKTTLDQHFAEEETHIFSQADELELDMDRVGEELQELRQKLFTPAPKHTPRVKPRLRGR